MSMKAIQILTASVMIVIMAVNLAAVGFIIASQTTIMRLEFYDGIFQKSRFYGQIRQWLFSRVSTELPNGREAIPYLEEVLTENWLRQELLFLGRQLFMFLKAETEQLPIIPVYKMFDELNEHMSDMSPAQRDKLIDYWFDAVPDRVRLQDIGSIEAFWVARNLMITFHRLVWLIIGILLVMICIFILVLRGWRNALVWLGAALAAAGGIIIEIGLFLNWAIMNSTSIQARITGMVKHMFPENAFESLIKFLLDGFLDRSYMVAFLFLAAGGLIILFWSSEIRFRGIK
jgi:hypothetical protein